MKEIFPDHITARDQEQRDEGAKYNPEAKTQRHWNKKLRLHAAFENHGESSANVVSDVNKMALKRR
jgi:hypothetical protein